jgi:hypothetical protein
VAVALVVTPAVLARGESTDAPVAPPDQTASPGHPARQPVLGTCPSNASRQGADLSVTATDIVLGPVRDDRPRAYRRGDIAITVCNAGGAVAPAGTLTMRWLATITMDVPLGTASWADCRRGEPVAGGDGLTYAVVNCDLPRLPPGSSWDRMFLFEMPANADTGIGRPLAQHVEVTTTGDLNTDDNRATFDVRAADDAGSVSPPAATACSSKPARQGADLAVVATALTLGPRPTGGEPWRGDIAITVRNIGRAAAPAGTLTLRWLATIRPDVPMGRESWAGCRYGEPEREGTVTYTVVDCGYQELEPGASSERVFLFEIPAGTDPGVSRPVNQYAKVSTTGDPNTGNNRTTFRIATV